VERGSSGIPFLAYVPRRNRVSDLLDDAARWRTRIHLIQGERRLTFGELFDEIERLALFLHDAGLGANDRLLLLAPNSIEWVAAMWAGIRLGAVVALGNSWWSKPDIAHAVDVVQPTLVVADKAELSLLPEGTKALDVASLTPLHSTPGPGGGSVPMARPDEDDPAIIIFTAGTTGFPKAVTLAHRSILANLHNLLAVSDRLPHQIDSQRPPAVILQSGPLFHMGGIQSLMLALLSGNTVVFLAGRFDPGEVLDLIDREHVTVWGAVPTMAARALEDPSIGLRDLSSVRSISMGGSPVPAGLLERLRHHFPNATRGLSTIYGMTETGGTVASASGALMAEHPTTAGRPLPVVEIRIDSPDVLGVGEIVVRTPGQLIGYWGQDKADILDEEAFVHTGDLGRIEDGLLYVTGRIKDLIIRAGENIAPAHVEAMLLTHPQVINAAVIGRPDDDLGEHVAAAVQIGPGDSLGRQELAAHIAPSLARFEMPAEWWIRTDPLPMTDAGKTDKRSLAAGWPEP
jgi:long-chain acyl-CoA synthetase